MKSVKSKLIAMTIILENVFILIDDIQQVKMLRDTLIICTQEISLWYSHIHREHDLLKEKLHSKFSLVSALHGHWRFVFSNSLFSQSKIYCFKEKTCRFFVWNWKDKKTIVYFATGNILFIWSFFFKRTNKIQFFIVYSLVSYPMTGYANEL